MKPDLGMKQCRRLSSALCPIVVAVSFGLVQQADAGDAATVSAEAVEFFEKEVRPVLAERCLKCHGREKQWAGLRLDSRAALLKGGDSGPAVSLDDLAASEVLLRVTEKDDSLRMPPSEEGGPLTTRQIEAIRRWIALGAPWPATAEGNDDPQASAADHWAFQPVRRPVVPDVNDRMWCRTPIDRFLLDRLESSGLAPSPPADRRTLIRRVTYDLTGLPPTPDEVRAFLADDRPDAYERLVDRLLASPHYGEQWGRHWLDVARYSDTKGYVYAREERFFVHAAGYRDWVVRAFNDDRPYDRFLRLQLAADEAAEDPRDLAAMGFLTLGRRFLGVTHDVIDDRIDVTCRGLMGLTVACARCHDHKFDPIPTADYYSLYGVFRSSAERTVPIPRATGADAPAAEYAQELEQRKRQLAEATAKSRAVAAERIRLRVADYLFAQRELEKYPEQGFDQVLAADDLIPAIVRRWQDYLADEARHDDPVFTAWFAYAALEPDQFPVSAAEGVPTSSISRVAAAFAEPPASPRDVADRYGRLFAEVDQAWRDLCEAAKRDGQPPPTSLPNPSDEAVRQVLYGPRSPCVLPDEPIVNTESLYDTATVNELWKLQGEVDRWLLQAPEAAPHAVILADAAQPADTRIFRRGNPANRGDEVPRQFLEVVAGPDRQPFTHGSGRLELANAIVDPENPLTPRVWVNRVWMHHFGAGLVRTPSDFGVRADPPSHPELLDWLASEFIAGGWSTKSLHRTIVLSAAYRQQSDGTGSDRRLALRTDPENRLLWRMNARRLGFEELRDSLAAVAGDLDGAMGGKPVDMLPAGAAAFRRSIYGLVDRQFVPGVMRIFDFANPDLHAPQRSETTVPQQALFALNHPFVAERARSLAASLESVPQNSTHGQAQQLCWTVLQREPTASQVNRALAFVQASQFDPSQEQGTQASLAWSYGYGEVDEAGALKSFHPLPHFTGAAWQGGGQWPDATLGWVQLTAEGGHPGNDLAHAAVRRWTAPRDGVISIESTVTHAVAAGDGICCRIASSRHGALATEAVHNRIQPMRPDAVEVRAGDTLDFITDIHANLNSDQFLWSAEIRLNGPAESGSVTTWHTERDFAGPSTPPLGPWAQLAQVLLMSNEFLFVD
ncbi:MAG: PSD1 and planctomycete cytochrome C domain-containing protein [Planctomycetaceae bacterium]